MTALIERRSLLVGIFSLVFTKIARAHDQPDFHLWPQQVQNWYGNAKVMPAARERLQGLGHPWTGCCDKSEVVKTKFNVSRVRDKEGLYRDEWYYQLPDKSWKNVPDDIIHWGEHAPDKQPTLFILNGIETCFYPGEDGN